MKLSRDCIIKAFEKAYPIEEKDLIREYSHRDVFKALYIAIHRTDINESKQVFTQIFMEELEKIREENIEE